MSADYRMPARVIRARRLRGIIVAALLAVVLSTVVARVARAETAPLPRLKAEVAIVGEIVTLGDLLENAGAFAATPVFRAPDPGTTGSVDAARVAAAAREAGLKEIDPAGHAMVIVSRTAREIGAADFARLIVSEIGKQDRTIDTAGLDIQFDETPPALAVDSRAAVPTRIASFAWSPVSNRFEAVLTLDRGAGPQRIRLRGEARETIEVVSLGRALERGELVTRDDFVVERRPRRAGQTAGRPVDVAALAGQVAKRQIRQGQAVSAADFAAPMQVNRNEAVTIVYEVPGLVLSVKGQALESGARGQTINILNQQSKRTIQATVAGPGKVIVNTAARVVAQGVTQ